MVAVLNWETIDQYQCFHAFSKISENIYNHFHKYVLENTVLYPKQFGFEVGYSADHAIIQLDDQIFEAFENNLYTLGVFIDLSKKPLKDYIK